MIKEEFGIEVYNDLVANVDLETTTRLALNEHLMYGSARLGVKRVDDALLQVILDGSPIVYQVVEEGINEPSYPYSGDDEIYYSQPTPLVKYRINRTRGYKQYELTNHLGNVMVTLSDRKVGVPNTAQTHYTSYTADVYTAQEYFAFGSPIFERKFSGGDGYRYGFNGHEKDDEVKGIGNSLDFGARIYDSRLGRWLAVDPLAAKYPSLSPYCFVGNSPILFVDPDGEKIVLSFKNGPNGEDAKKAYLQVINDALEGQFTGELIRIPKTNKYELKFKATVDGGDVSKLTTSGYAFYMHMNKVIRDEEITVEQQVVYSDPDIVVGQYTSGKIDIADVLQFNVTGPNIEAVVGFTRAGKVVHEVIEQYERVKAGIELGSMQGYKDAHEIAKKAENDVNQSTRLGDKIITGGFESSYKQNGKEKKVIINRGGVFSRKGTIEVQQEKPTAKSREIEN